MEYHLWWQLIANWPTFPDFQNSKFGIKCYFYDIFWRITYDMILGLHCYGKMKKKSCIIWNLNKNIWKFYGCRDEKDFMIASDISEFTFENCYTLKKLAQIHFQVLFVLIRSRFFKNYLYDRPLRILKRGRGEWTAMF